MRVRGWCPGLHDPMESGDGWLVRVRPPFGRLSPAQAAGLDALAASCGNGIIEITSRGALQVRGVHAHARLVDGVCRLGLGERDPVRERRRRLMVAPFADRTLVGWVEQALMGCEAVDGLPVKFVVRVDDGPVSIADAPADLAISRVGDEVRVERASRTGRASARVGRVSGLDAVGVAPRFGQFGPGELAALAARTGDDLRLMPRSVMATGVADGFADGLGMITDPGDPLLSVSACVGAPRCASAVGPARDVAERYVGLGRVHVSGCEKGCGHSGGSLLLVPGSGAARPGGVQGRSPWP